MAPTNAFHNSRRPGRFRQAASLLGKEIREAGESRGFTVSRVLTHWSEIVGEELARSARPVEISYGREGLGATLTVLTTGAMAPIVEMQKPAIKDRVNACYGYAAISRVRVTQTSPTGFSEGRAEFKAAPTALGAPSEQLKSKADALASQVEDNGLRSALSALAANVLKRNSP